MTDPMTMPMSAQQQYRVLRVAHIAGRFTKPFNGLLPAVRARRRLTTEFLEANGTKGVLYAWGYRKLHRVLVVAAMDDFKGRKFFSALCDDITLGPVPNMQAIIVLPRWLLCTKCERILADAIKE